MTWTRRERVLLAASLVSTALLVGTLLYSSSNTSPQQSNSVNVKVSYQGAWSLTWVGYEGGPDHPTSGGSLVGYGNQSLTATVFSNSNRYGVSICAWAGKLDNSNRTLTLGIYSIPTALAVGGQQETAAPLGIVKVCGRAVP